MTKQELIEEVARMERQISLLEAGRSSELEEELRGLRALRALELAVDHQAYWFIDERGRTVYLDRDEFKRRMKKREKRESHAAPSSRLRVAA